MCMCTCRYVSVTYGNYHSFLDGSASLEVDNFLKQDQELRTFGKVRD